MIKLDNESFKKIYLIIEEFINEEVILKIKSI